MTIVDRLLRRFGLQRRVAKRNAFVGAQTGRLALDWARAPLASADREVAGDLLELRKRSRDACRNNAYARRFLRMAQNNIVGPKGIALRPSNMIGQRPHDRVNDAVAAAWRRWGQAKYASTAGTLSWVRLQRLAVAEWLAAGEAIFQVVRDRENPFGISLHPIDADRLDHSYNLPGGEGQNEIRYGVEIDPVGRRLAYHVLSVHPSEIGRTRGRRVYRERIPAAEVVHLALLDERVDLTRGVPQLAVALRDLRHLDGAQEASLVAMRMAAANPGFIVTRPPDGGEPLTPDGDVYLDGEPGQLTALGLGQEPVFPDTNQPRDNYPDFTRAVLRAIAASLGTSYAFLVGDWSDASFSSMRLGRADEQDTWTTLQEWMIEEFCQRVFDLWLPSAVLSGALLVPDYDIRRASAVMWQGRRWVSPKPTEDVEVHERRVALGLDSRTEIAAHEGRDLWSTWDYLREEQEYAEEMGLNIEPPRKALTPGAEDGKEIKDGPASGDASAGPRPDAATPGDGADDRDNAGRGRVASAGNGRLPHRYRYVVGAAGGAVRLVDE